MMYQHDLLNTYREAWRRRGWVAWALSLALLSFYLILYFTEWLTPLAQIIGLRSKWWLYGSLYCSGMVVGGIYFLRRHGNNRYHRIRTAVLLSVQILLAFALPFVMDLFGKKVYYFPICGP